jgi:hypothetical protein
MSPIDVSYIVAEIEKSEGQAPPSPNGSPKSPLVSRVKQGQGQGPGLRRGFGTDTPYKPPSSSSSFIPTMRTRFHRWWNGSRRSTRRAGVNPRR